MNHQRLVELDAIRGIAASAVVLFHYFLRYDQIYGHQDLSVNWSYMGYFGVHLFFMLSGFVIFWTLNRVERPLDFIASRFSRLYPAYWCAIIVTFSIVYIFGLPGREISISSALANGIMIHEYLRIPHVDGAYWTLTVELTFYFWIFLLYLFSCLDKAEEFFSTLILVSTLKFLDIISINQFITSALLLKYAPFFLAGICFYKIVNNCSGIKTNIALAFSLISTIVIYSFKLFILFSLFYLLFFLAVSGRFKILTFRPLVFLGSISYSYYLLHQNIGYVVINKSYELQLHPLIGISFAMAISIALATVLMKFIEKPSLNYIRQAYKNNMKIQRIADKLTPFITR
jgi:peptidoglycan/LPS O-acetylase OafA/YrhL